MGSAPVFTLSSSRRHSFALADPLLDSFLDTLHLVHSLVIAHLTVRLACLDEFPHALHRSGVVVGDDGIFLLVLPGQVAHIPRGNGDSVMRSSDTGDDGDSGSEQDVAVSRNDASGHGGDKNVDGARKELLTGLLGRSKRSEGAGE